MNRLEIMADKLECTELVARLAKGIDRCDADMVRDCFHPDATDDHGAFKGCCQSNANSSPLGRAGPTRAPFQAMRVCHSAKAAERFSL